MARVGFEPRPCRSQSRRFNHFTDNINIIISDPDIKPKECKENFKFIHTTITLQYLRSRKNRKITNTPPRDLHSFITSPSQ